MVPVNLFWDRIIIKRLRIIPISTGSDPESPLVSKDNVALKAKRMMRMKGTQLAGIECSNSPRLVMRPISDGILPIRPALLPLNDSVRS